MVKLLLEGDATGAVRATVAVNAEAKQLVLTFKEISDATDKAAHSHNQAFGEKTLRELSSYAAGLLTIRQAVDFVAESFRVLSERKAQAGERAAGELAVITPLAQTARTPAEFAAGLAESRRLRPLVGGNQQQAEDIAAKMLAAGLTGAEQADVETSLRQRTTTGEAAGTLIENIRGFQRLFGGSFQEVSKKALETSRLSGGRFAPHEALALALRAKEAGEDASGDQLLGALAEIGQVTPQSRRAAQQAEKLFTEGEEPFGFSQKRATEYAQQIHAMGLTRRTDYLAADPRLHAARTFEEESGEAELADEELFSEQERLGRAIYRRRTAKAARRGFGARVYQYWAQKSPASWEEIIEEGSHMGGELGRQSTEYLRRQGRIGPEPTMDEIADQLRQQTEIMRRDDRSPPPPNGRQEP